MTNDELREAIEALPYDKLIILAEVIGRLSQLQRKKE